MLFITFLSIISVEVVTVFIILGFMSLLYWVFDLYFLAYINFLIFGIPIYSHKKCAIIFIIIFSSVFKFLSTFEYIYNPDYNLFYKNHIFIIPIIIISYLLLSLTRFYSLCKIYWFLDYKFIPVRIYFSIHNFIGTILFLIVGLISNGVKCVDKATFNDIDLICLIKIENEYYFDSFPYFFEQLWKKDENTFINLFYLLLFIIRLLLNSLKILYTILIIRFLNPEYYLCSYEIYLIIKRFIGLIKAITNNGDIKLEIYNILAEIGAIIGILIYLELIELNFCNLNHNLKKNIENRGISEYNIDNLYNELDNIENN